MGGKSSKQSASTTQQVVPWSGVQPGLKEAYGAYSDLFKAGGPQYYPGQTYVSPDPLQNYAQNLSLAYATQSLPQQFGQTQQALGQMLNAPDVANNPYIGGIADVIAKRQARQFTEQMAPSIRSGAIAAGQFGGSRQALAERGAMRDVSEATGDALAQLYGDAYSQGLGQQARGVGFAPSIMQTGMLPFQVMGDVGAYRRGAAQEALAADMDRFNYLQEQPYAAADRYLAALGQTPWGSQSTQKQPGTSPLAGAVGGGLTGLGAAQFLSSPAGAGIFGGTPTLAGLGSAGTLGLWGLGGALLGGLLG